MILSLKRSSGNQVRMPPHGGMKPMKEAYIPLMEGRVKAVKVEPVPET